MCKPIFASFGLAVLTVSTAFTQLQDNRDKHLSCDEGRFSQNWAHKCEVHEQTLASVGQLTVEPGRNGGVAVRGWTRNDVLVRARMDAWGASDSEAALLLTQVHSDASAGRVAATGPETANKVQWSVSYEIFAPQALDLKIAAFNGPISVWDVAGRMELDTKNGPLELRRVSGDITGKTKNGPVRLELAGNNWQGRQLDLETKNGPVDISVPANFQAHIQAETVRGPIRSDFGGLVADGNRSPRKVDLNLGGGGASLKIATTNGPIRLARL
jgi:DUF4097 and DUF4098 domain-containing protein YvlB